MKNLDWTPQLLATAVLQHAARALGRDAALMPLKGVLLGVTHYDRLGDRPVCDCDLLVATPSLDECVRRLHANGYEIVPGSRSLEVVTLSTPLAMTLDLHARPLPVGIGRVSTPWMFETARRDDVLFGAPVWIPDERRLLVHLLGNIAKDHVFRAATHTFDDVRRVLERRIHTIDAFADTIADGRLRAASWIVLSHLLELRRHPDLAALREALRLSRSERRLCTWRLDRLRRSAAHETPRLWARIVARVASDSLRDDVLGLAHATAGAAAEWWSRPEPRR